MGGRLRIPQAGEKFGRLTVATNEVTLDDHRRKLIEVVCDCGQEATVRLDELLAGRRVSCGCMQKVSGIRNLLKQFEDPTRRILTVSSDDCETVILNARGKKIKEVIIRRGKYQWVVPLP